MTTLDLVLLKLATPGDTRCDQSAALLIVLCSWLSMDRAVQILIKTMPAVICALHEIQAMQPSEKKSGSLAKKIATHTFAGALSIMADVLPVFADVCTTFQTEVRNTQMFSLKFDYCRTCHCLL
jgi:hypothetical protein